MTNTPTSPLLSSPEPPIMTSQMHPDGGPLNKGVGDHAPSIMTPVESPLHGVSHISLTPQNDIASHTQNKVASMNHISDLTKTDEEHAVVELDMPSLSASSLQAAENFHFADKPSNPDSATTTETLSGKGATEIPLNDGIVEMNSSAEKSVGGPAQKNKSKSRDKDQLVSELEAVSHMLDNEEANGESGMDPIKDDIKGKLLDIDSGLFRDEKMHKVDLTGILNEADSSITDEIRNAQEVQGIKLTDTGSSSEPEKTINKDSENQPNGKSHKKNKFMRYVATQKAQRRVATPTSSTISSTAINKKNNGTGLTDEDEKMINDILEESELLEKTHSTMEKGDTNANRKEYTATPTVSSRMKKIIADKRRKGGDISPNKEKCSANNNNVKCHNLKDAPKHKEPLPPTKPPRGDSNPVEQDKNTEDTVSSKNHHQHQQQQPTIKLKLHDLHPNNNNRKNGGNPVQSKSPTGQQKDSSGSSSKAASSKLHSTFSTANFIKPAIKVEKNSDDKMALLFSRGAPTNKSLIHPYSTTTAADDITRK